MLANILIIAGGVLMGVIATLTVIAQRTHNPKVERALEDAEEAKKILDIVEGEVKTTPATPDAAGK